MRLNVPSQDQVNEWRKRIEDEDPEALYDLLKELNPFAKDNEKSDDDVKVLTSFLEAFYESILSSEIDRRKIKGMCARIFKFSDMYILTIQGITSKISKSISEKSLWNIYWVMRFIPLPNKRLYPLYRDDYETSPISNDMLIDSTHQMWSNFVKLELPPRLYKLLIPYFVENVLDVLPNAELFGDFLFACFNKGHIYSILSLAGIFKLIVNRNFEYPDFYSQVYRLTTSSVCYSSYSQKFFELLDLFLSSTHIPAYILASFVKKLCRILLNAPINHQLMLLTLVRNLVTRHSILLPLIHREEPSELSSDPYDENAPNPKNSGAMDSSLWELKIIQKHWYDRISKKADFLDRQAQEQENALNWKTNDEIFDEIMARKFIFDPTESSKEFDQDEEDTEVKKKKKRVTFVELGSDIKHYPGVDDLPMNYIKPDINFIRSISNTEDLWKV